MFTCVHICCSEALASVAPLAAVSLPQLAGGDPLAQIEIEYASTTISAVSYVVLVLLFRVSESFFVLHHFQSHPLVPLSCYCCPFNLAVAFRATRLALYSSHQQPCQHDQSYPHALQAAQIARFLFLANPFGASFWFKYVLRITHQSKH